MSSNFFDFENKEIKVPDNNRKVFSVYELNEYVESLLNSDSVLRSISIEGEISGLKKYYTSGHSYFILKDEKASIKCVLFKGYSNSLNFTPKDGMRVVISGSVSLYSRDGSYQFYVKTMNSVGDGELYERFLRLKAKLDEEGLFDECNKKKIPCLPNTIGIATSRQGAVVHDIVSVARRRYPKMNFLLCHCSVQGVDATDEIVNSIKYLDNSGLVDVIIVGRGGGSAEDLWCFNTESVARAVYECKTPIISAVGHETDFTICDFVADVRAATPSAAAELAVPVYSDIINLLNDYRCSMAQRIRHSIFVMQNNVYSAEMSLISPRKLLNNQIIKINSLYLLIKSQVVKKLELFKIRLASEVKTTNALSPLRIIEKGFVTVKGEQGKLIKSAAVLKKQKQATISFTDGDVMVKTIDADDL